MRMISIKDTQFSLKTIFILFLITIPLLYIFRWKYFIYEHIDTTWSASLAYNFFYFDTVKDILFHQGLATLNLFGQLPAYFYNLFLGIWGWEVHTISLVSTMLAIVGLSCWYFIIKEFGFSKRDSFITILLAAISYSFFFSAHSARTDIFVFASSAVSTILFIKKRYFWAGVFTVIAIESHPTGVFAFLFHLTWILSERKKLFQNRSSLIIPIVYYVLAISLGTVLYLSLHMDYLSIQKISSKISETNAPLWKKFIMGLSKNYLVDYFIVPITRFLSDSTYTDRATTSNNQIISLLYVGRNLLFLLVIIIAACVFILNNGVKKFPALGWFLTAILISAILLPRGNSFYFLHAIPVIMALIVAAGLNSRLLTLMTLYVYFFFMGQYLIYFYLNKESHSLNEYYQYRENIYKFKREKNIPLYGTYNDWFAFKKDPSFKLIINLFNNTQEISYPMYVIFKEKHFEISQYTYPFERFLEESNHRVVDKFADPWHGEVVLYYFSDQKKGTSKNL